MALKLDADGAQAKAERWRQTAISAIKQCGQPWLPEVAQPISLAGLLAAWKADELALVGSPQNDGRHPRDYFDEFRARHGRAPASVTAWIGPEGDFTDAELDLIRASGARPITLGPLILRSETAALCALSIIQHELRRRLTLENRPHGGGSTA